MQQQKESAIEQLQVKPASTGSLRTLRKERADSLDPKEPKQQCRPTICNYLVQRRIGVHAALNRDETECLIKPQKKLPLESIVIVIKELHDRINELEEISKLLETDPKMFGQILFDSFRNNKPKLIHFLLGNKLVSVDTTDSRGLTLLHYALLCSYFDLAKELITTYHADLNFNSENKSILDFIDAAIQITAETKRRTPIFQKTINELTNIKTLVNSYRQKPITPPANNGSIIASAARIKEDTKRTIKHLTDSIKQLARIRQNPHQELFAAAYSGNTNVLAEILKYDVNVNILDRDHQSPLHIAALRNNTNAAKMLVNIGHVNVDVLDEEKLTPLTIAAQKGNAELVSFLINEAHADPNLGDAHAFKAIHHAILRKDITMLNILLNASQKSINCLAFKSTPLDLVNEYLDIVQEKKNAQFQTTVQRKQLEYIKEILIKYGAKTVAELHKLSQSQSSSSSSFSSALSTSAATTQAVSVPNNSVSSECPKTCAQLPEARTATIPIYSTGQIFALHQSLPTPCSFEAKAS
jgi:ankyrin repeat protein